MHATTFHRVHRKKRSPELGASRCPREWRAGSATTRGRHGPEEALGKSSRELRERRRTTSEVTAWRNGRGRASTGKMALFRHKQFWLPRASKGASLGPASCGVSGLLQSRCRRIPSG